MTVLVTGASGLVGRALVTQLEARGERAVRLVRRAPQGADEALWDPALGAVEGESARAADAVVHLAGESVASGRWTPARKARIRDSRVGPTRALATWLAQLGRPPLAFICASGVGYYGDRGEAVLDESSPPGAGFLAGVCHEWEAATQPAEQAGIRVVSLRIGLVLSAAGGALPRMLRPFRLGAGGVVGSGQQWMSWIALDDLVEAILRAVADERLRGPVNAVAPNPVTNGEFTRTLARVLGRPALLPLPRPAVWLLFGEMGEALLLASARVRPRRLEEAAHRFRHPALENALRHVLDRPR